MYFETDNLTAEVNAQIRAQYAVIDEQNRQMTGLYGLISYLTKVIADLPSAQASLAPGELKDIVTHLAKCIDAFHQSNRAGYETIRLLRMSDELRRRAPA